MSLFDEMKRDMQELLGLVKASENYCATIAVKPDLASDESHSTEVAREHRIVELKGRLGLA